MSRPNSLAVMDDIEFRVDPTNPVGSVLYQSAEYLDPDEQLTEEEQIERENARSNMRDFIQYTFPQYKADWFHLNVCDHIDRLVHVDHPEGHLSHLMLFAPPQHGKSEIVATRLPGFFLAHNPHLPVALMSYGDDLALRNGTNAREVVESPMYQELFQSWGIAPDTRKWRKRDWHLQDYKGFVRAASMRGTITGHGFGLGIIDDPVKDWAEAQSETIREALWQWWKGTFKTRFWEGHRMILMMTRWHEDDIAARVLRQEGNLNLCRDCGEYMPDDYDPKKCPKCGGPRGRWKVLAYSALAENQDDRDAGNKTFGLPEGLPDPLGRRTGAPLAPSRFGAVYLREIRRDAGELVWGAEYQQHPTPPKGDFFKIGRVQIEELYPVEQFGGDLEAFVKTRIPVGMKKCIRYWDLAASEAKQGTDPDWTSGSLLGIDQKTLLTWVLHQVSIRVDAAGVEDMIRETALLDGKKVPIRIEQEPGAAGKALIAGLTRKLAGYHVEGIPSSGDKQVRAYNFSSQVNAGNVRLVDAQWNQRWLAVHRAFPHGQHDDEVDSTSGAYNVLTGPETTYRQKFMHV